MGWLVIRILWGINLAALLRRCLFSFLCLNEPFLPWRGLELGL